MVQTDLTEHHARRADVIAEQEATDGRKGQHQQQGPEADGIRVEERLAVCHASHCHAATARASTAHLAAAFS